MATTTVSQQFQAEQLIEKAKATLARLRGIEREAGLTPPEDQNAFILASTADAALHAAIQLLNWDIAAEAYVMLHSALEQVASLMEEQNQREMSS